MQKNQKKIMFQTKVLSKQSHYLNLVYYCQIFLLHIKENHFNLIIQE